jgi:hypothetical protein
MAVTPRQLLRLYPGLWRVRYGDEFLALLEKTPVTRAIVIDVLRAAAREWVGHTRVGRLLLGCVVGEAATIIAYGMARVVPPAAIFGGHRMDSLSALVLMLLSGTAPLVIGSLLIVLRTRRDRRFAWLGLRHQVAALALAAVWSEWATLGWIAGAEVVPILNWKSGVGSAFYLTWMLLLLFNVDRSRESFYPRRGPASWVRSDWPA